MFRWFNPVLFAGVAIYVRHYNASHSGSQLLFPGVQELTGGDLYAAGTLTWQLFAGFSVLLLLWAIYREVRIRRARAEADEE